MKRIFCVLIATLLIFTFCSCNKTELSFSYTENETGITVTSCSGMGKVLTVPDEIDGKKVTSVAPNAFEGCQTLEEITLPQSIAEIPDGCFKDCTNLSVVNAPEVTKVGSDAFEGTKLIQADGFVTVGDGILIAWNGVGNHVTVPDTVKDVGTVFRGNKSIKTIFLPDGVKRIGAKAFMGCTELYEVSFSPSLYYIGPYAFSECYSLDYVDIPPFCHTIDDYAFSRCYSLESITIPDSVWDIGFGILHNSDNAVITTPFESTAFTYAVEHDIAVE